MSVDIGAEKKKHFINISFVSFPVICFFFVLNKIEGVTDLLHNPILSFISIFIGIINHIQEKNMANSYVKDC